MIKAIVLLAHMAATGWAYDRVCCSGLDCDQVSTESISLIKHGYLIELQPGEHHFAPEGYEAVIGYDDTRIRRSQDQFYHVCMTRSKRLLCVYVPEMMG